MNRVNENISSLQRFQREERKPGWKKEEEEAGGGAKGVALQTSPATCRYPGVMGLYPGPPEKGGLELGPTRNQTRPEPEFEFSAKGWWSVSNSQLRLRPFDQIPAFRTGGLEKPGRRGRVKERKERGKGREVNKVSCSLPGRGTLASCPCQEDTRDKKVPVVATGSCPGNTLIEIAHPGQVPL